MDKPGNVLMVCLGNICRSPIAEGVFKNMSSDLNVKVDSAGTSNYHTNFSPDKRSIKIAKKNGIDIRFQKARQLKIEDFTNFDYIFAMDKQNLIDIRQIINENKTNCKIQLLNDPFEIEDPYYGDDKDFELVYDKIYKGCKRVIDNWK